jgi:hypothetical protein
MHDVRARRLSRHEKSEFCPKPASGRDRGLGRTAVWDEKLLKGSFWSLNIGLAAMALLSLLPHGLMQVHAAVTHGFWYARSAEFLQQPLMQTLVWMRMPGDVIFSIGVGMLALFVAKLYGIDLSTANLALVAASSVVLNFSTPGIPSGGMLLQVPLYTSIGLPVEGIGILIALDTLPDMFKTLLNVTSDMMVAVMTTPKEQLTR